MPEDSAGAIPVPRIPRASRGWRLARWLSACAVAVGLPLAATDTGADPPSSSARIDFLQEIWSAASEPCPGSAESPSAAAARASDGSAQLSPVATLPAPYRAGELALYDVRWGILKAGEIRLEVKPQARLSGRPVWHFAGRAESSALVRMFYRAEDSFESLVDQRSFLPVGLHIRVDESGEQGERSVFYDHRAGIAHYRKDRTRHKRGPKTTCRKDPLDPQALDVIAALYRLRTVELEPGSTIHLPVYDNGKSWQARVEVLPRTEIKTGLGHRPALPLRVSSQIDGKLSSEKDLLIWLSDDPQRVMLGFEASLGWGKLRASLSGYRPAAGYRLQESG